MPVPAGKSHVWGGFGLDGVVNAVARPTCIPRLCSRKASNAQRFGTEQPRTVLRSESALMRGSGQHTPKILRSLGY